MEPSVVEVSRPFFDPGPGVGHRQDPGGVQAFLAQSAVERLDMRVVAGFSGPRDVQFDLVERGLLLEQTPGELGAVVDANALRLASEPGEAVERFDDLTGAKFVLAAVESASRVWTSTTVKIRKDPPSNSLSDTKSIAHMSFAPPASGRPARYLQTRRRRGVHVRIDSPFSR